jgi:hypothetical protein
MHQACATDHPVRPTGEHRSRNKWRKLPACEATIYRTLEACATGNPGSYFSIDANVLPDREVE